MGEGIEDKAADAVDQPLVSESNDTADGPANAPEAAPARRSRLRWYLAILVLLLIVVFFNRSWVAAIPNAQAKACLEARNWEGASRWLTYARRISSRNAETEFLLARLARKQDELGLVDGHLQRAKELGWAEDLVERELRLTEAQGGHLREAMPHLATLLQSAAGDGREICEAYVRGIIRAKNNLRTAQELLTIWQTDFPKDAQPYYLLAQLSLQFRDTAQTEAHLRKALELDANHAPSALALGSLLLDQNQLEAAVKLFDIAAARTELRQDALIGKARCLRLSGQVAAASTLVDELLTQYPDSVDAQLEKAQLELAGKANPETVQKRLEGVLQREPRNAAACQLLANVFTSLGNEEGARQLTGMATEIQAQLARGQELTQQVLRDPTDLNLRFQVGRTHLVFGDAETGLDWLRGSLDIDPQHRPTLELLASYFENKPDQTPEEWQLSRKYRRQLGTLP